MNDFEKNELWLDITKGLAQSLTTEAEATALLAGLSRTEFAFLANRETDRVNKALEKICLAGGEEEVKAIFNALPRDTQRALIARIQTAYSIWRDLGHKECHQLWHPPRQQDLWRAVFLAMIVDQAVKTDLRERILTGTLGSDRR